MELESTRVLPVERAVAWAALNDPEALKASIPGCESMERTGENEYAVVVMAAVGPVKARFRGRISIVDAAPPERYTIHFEGQGGPAGFAKGSAHVELAEAGRETRMAYSAKAQVGGRLAQVGQRLIDAAASKVADDFFAAFAARLAPPAAAEVPPEAVSRAPLWIIVALMALLVAITFFLRG